MYALADCNNFFVSCERVFRPDLQGRPVVVLSGNDGCVVSRSNEAKQIGIKMGVPLYQIRDLVQKTGTVYFSSNFSLYGDLSSRVMSLLSAHTEHLEQYSIDEAFLDLSHVAPAEQKAYAEQLVQKILRGVGIPISIGIASSKTLAKVASKYAKKYPGYHGACCIADEVARKKALADFPIGDVWGIGRRSQEKCQRIGIKTALDYANLGEVQVKNIFNLPGWRTWRELNGFDEIRFSEVEEKQSITQSRTFAESVSDRAALEKYLADFTSSCADKLRRQHSVCRQLAFFVETSRFRTDIPQKVIYQTITFPVPTNLTAESVGSVLAEFRAQYEPGYLFKRAGVVLLSISSDAQVQQRLFDVRDRQRDERLQKAIDSVNARYGKKAIIVATQVSNAATDGMLRSEHLSPCYSTNIRDIITLKC